jgi:hypothetical protein
MISKAAIKNQGFSGLLQLRNNRYGLQQAFVAKISHDLAWVSLIYCDVRLI